MRSTGSTRKTPLPTDAALPLILLEDEPILRQELQEFLGTLGYTPTCAATLREFEQRFDPQLHRIAILDIGLPDGNGLHLTARLRQQGHQLGIIVLTAHDTAADKIDGLESGADHYLSKTCDLDELAATLAALARRLSQYHDDAYWLLDWPARTLAAPRQASLALTEQEAQILQCLMLCEGRHLKRRQLVEALGQDYLVYDPQRLDTLMSRLRRKVLARTGESLPVKTSRNQGYCFFRPARVKA